MSLKIEDYALIGDCQTAALVGNNGSIDWLCLPRFDSASCFAALLGDSHNGCWQIAPCEAIVSTKRSYLGDTLVLETIFETATGSVALIDFMPVRETAPDVIRIVEGRRGTVKMRSALSLRFDYGTTIPWVRKFDGDISGGGISGGGISAIAGPNAVKLVTPVQTHGENMTTVAEFEVKEGDRVPFVLTWYRSYDVEPKSVNAEHALRDTIAFWEEWSSRCTYRGKYRPLVLRSLITLKAMTYAPSGGIVAAPTTSLPEHLGGVRNWDYRYCWLRDATLTLLSFLNCGYVDEADAWRHWLLRAIAGDVSQLQIMYGIGGERRLDEFEVPWLSGYENSKPVRIGNGAATQFQLDVYGEVIDAMHQARISGQAFMSAGWAMGLKIADFVMKKWDSVDEGIWEVRGPKRHFTHSKVMAWVALDRMIQSAEHWALEAPVEEWKRTRAIIHERVCREGFSAKLNSFTQSFGVDLLDASVLMIPLVGFLPPDDPRVRGTVEAIEKHLTRDGFVLRYDTTKSDDGLPPGEGAFLPCTFWLAECYAMMGETDHAREIFERLLSLGNDVGLFSEEYDDREKRLIGNFPQAFTHLGLIDTALTLEKSTHAPCEQRAGVMSGT